MDANAEKLWQIIVMIKRDLDSHVTNPTKYEMDKATWEEAVSRCKEICPERCN